MKKNKYNKYYKTGINLIKRIENDFCCFIFEFYCDLESHFKYVLDNNIIDDELYIETTKLSNFQQNKRELIEKEHFVLNNFKDIIIKYENKIDKFKYMINWINQLINDFKKIDMNYKDFNDFDINFNFESNKNKRKYK